jgi:hypothetical protein
MSESIKKSLLVFFIAQFLIAIPLFLFPINLFKGKVEIEINGKTATEEAPLSLSYFIGKGYEPSEMIDIKKFYLTTEGYLMAFVFLVGIPTLVALRFSTSKKSH